MFDNSLIPGWIGHRSHPLNSSKLWWRELAIQLKDQSQSGTLGQMTFVENVAVLRFGAHNLLRRQDASTADRPNKDGPCC